MKVEFGALSDPLHIQLQLPKRRMRYLQEMADALVHLKLGRLLSEAEVHRARQRLLKRIAFTFKKELQAREVAHGAR